MALEVAAQVEPGEWHAHRRPGRTKADGFAVMHPWLFTLLQHGWNLESVL